MTYSVTFNHVHTLVFKCNQRDIHFMCTVLLLVIVFHVALRQSRTIENNSPCHSSLHRGMDGVGYVDDAFYIVWNIIWPAHPVFDRHIEKEIIMDSKEMYRGSLLVLTASSPSSIDLFIFSVRLFSILHHSSYRNRHRQFIQRELDELVCIMLTKIQQNLFESVFVWLYGCSFGLCTYLSWFVFHFAMI